MAMAPQTDQYQIPEENQFRGQDNLFDMGMEKFNQVSPIPPKQDKDLT